MGVCGRTGSGKSSIALALLDMLEITQGDILIDDVNIKNVDLHTLRSRITMVPQDPVLFTGTVR